MWSSPAASHLPTMALARAASRLVATAAPRVAAPVQSRAITTSRVARGGHAEMFTPEKYNPLGAPRAWARCGVSVCAPLPHSARLAALHSGHLPCRPPRRPCCDCIRTQHPVRSLDSPQLSFSRCWLLMVCGAVHLLRLAITPEMHCPTQTPLQTHTMHCTRTACVCASAWPSGLLHPARCMD